MSFEITVLGCGSASQLPIEIILHKLYRYKIGAFDRLRGRNTDRLRKNKIRMQKFKLFYFSSTW